MNATIQSQQQQSAQLHGQANTLQGQVAALNAQITQVQAEIQLNQAKAQQLNDQITQAQQELNTKKSILDEEIRAIYQDSQITPLEMLASSQNLSDFIDKQQYNDQIKSHIQDELAQIDQLKSQLEKQQISLNATLAAQTAQQSSLGTLQAQQTALLNQTQSQANATDNAVSANKSKLQGLYATRAALDARNNVTIAVGGGNGGYPWANAAVNYNGNCVYPNGSVGADPWGDCYRQCTSFAAWHRHYYQDGAAMPYDWGNAGDWAGPWGADRAGAYDYTPSVGAIAVFKPYGRSGAGDVGHVAIVIGVHGGTIDVAEYNWQPFEYDVRYNVPVVDMVFIH